MKRLVRASIGVAIASAGTAQASPSLGWIASQVFQRIELSGRRSIGLHFYKISGDREAQRYSNLYGNGNSRFTDFGSISVVGREVLGLFNFNATINDNRFTDPDTRNFSLNYRKKGFQFNAGTIQGSLLNTNMFSGFSRFLTGVNTGVTHGNLSFMALVSQARGTTQTVSFQGNNSTGPYYLNSSRVVSDSVQVRIDGLPQSLGTDYTVDRWTGTINFFRPISPASAIVVSYEALSDNGAGGSILGSGLAYDMGRAGKFGLSALEQRQAGNNGNGTITDKFAGRPAIFPYTLSFTPLAGTTIIVHVDSQTLVRGLDFFVNVANPREVTLARDVLDSQTVFITYIAPSSSSVNGNRRVVGVDYTLPLGKRGASGSLSVSEAVGGFTNGGSKGTARGAELNYTSRGLKTVISVRDVPDTFTGVESGGFNRNERAYDALIEFKRRSWTYGLSSGNSLIASRLLSSTGEVSYLHGRYVQERAFANLTQSHDSSWTIEQVRSATRYGTSPKSRTGTTSISNTRSLGRLTAKFSLEREDAMAPNSVGGTSTMSHFLLNTARTGLDYSLKSGWALGAHAALSSIQTDGKKSAGHDIRLVSSYETGKRFTFSSTYALSNSGALSSLTGFQNGAGLGYGGNGFNGANATTGTFGTNYNAGTTNLRLWNTHAAYLLSPRASVLADFTSSSTAGSLTTNSSGTNLSLDLNLDLGRSTSLWAGFNRSSNAFIGTQLASKATSLNFRLSGSPKGLWSYDLFTSMLLSNGSTIAQNSYHFDASLNYRLSKVAGIGASFSNGRTLNFRPQQDSQFAVFFRRRIYGDVNLLTTYRFHNVANLVPNASGAYRSHGLDIELELGFNGGH